MACPSAGELEKALASIEPVYPKLLVERPWSGRVWGTFIRAFKLFREIAEHYTLLFDDGQAIVIDLMSPVGPVPEKLP